MQIKTNAICVALLRLHNIHPMSLVAALKRQLEVERALVKDASWTFFRSAKEPPTRASRNQMSSPCYDFPEQLPFIAGCYGDNHLRLTAIAITDTLLWYRQNSHATLVVRGASVDVPEAIRQGLIGERATRIVDHPLLEASREKVIKINRGLGSLSATITNTNIEMTIKENI